MEHLCYPISNLDETPRGPPWKTKVTLENQPFSIGNTSSNGRCVIVILAFWGVYINQFSLFAYLTHPKVGFLEEHLWMFFVGLTMRFITIFHHKRNYPSIATPPLCINFRYFTKRFKCIRSSHPILNLPQRKLAMRPFNSHPTDLWETTRIGNRIFFCLKKKIHLRDGPPSIPSNYKWSYNPSKYGSNL